MNDSPLSIIKNLKDYLLLKKVFGKAIKYNYDRIPNENNLVLFGARKGRGYEGNTKIVYESIVDKHPSIKPVWVTRNEAVYYELKKAGKPVINPDSLYGLYMLSRASVGCFTHSAWDIAHSNDIIPNNLTLINASHGNPVKNIIECGGYKENYIKTDYFIGTSKYLQKRMYGHCLYYDSKKHVITGYPRNDTLYQPPADQKNDVISFIQKSNPKMVILFAPTRIRPGGECFGLNKFDEEDFTSFLEDKNILFLIRLHPNDKERLKGDRDLSSETESVFEWIKHMIERTSQVRFANNDLFSSANYLLPHINVLITDYSSIYHDYLLLNRPIIFTPYDYDNYQKEHNFLYDYFEQMPGPAITNYNFFCHYLNQLYNGQDPHKQSRIKLQKKCHKHLDSDSTRRVIDLIMKNIR